MVTRIVAATAAVVIGALGVMVPSAAQAAPSGAIAGIIADGTPAFDAAAGPGFDTGPSNGILRTGDDVQYDFQYNFTSTGAINPVIRSQLPVGMRWLRVPVECTGTGSPASGIYNVAGNDGRVLVCQLPTATSALSSRITPQARLDSTITNGTPLPVSFTLAEAGGTPITSNTATVTASQEEFPRYDLAKFVIGTGTVAAMTGPNGVEPGQVITYGVRVSTPWTGAKGGQVLAQPIQFTDDISGLPPFAAMTECRGRTEASATCTRNGNAVTVTGTFNRSGSEYQISFAVPNSVIRNGVDGTAGTADDGRYPSTNVLRDFDPTSVSGASNFGTDVEPLANNSVSRDLTIGAPSVPVPTKLWTAADGRPIGGSVIGFDARLSGYVQDGINTNITGTSEIVCDVFDNTAVQLALIPGASVPVRVEEGAVDSFVIEYGRAVTPPTNLAQHQASRCGDADATWSTDPTDAALGTGLTTDGYQNGIDRVRVRFTPVTDSVRHAIRVGFRAMSTSARTGSTLYNVGQKQLDDRAWQNSTHSLFFSGGELGITKTAVPQGTGTGNHYAAGQQIRFNLAPRIVQTSAVVGTMQNVQVTDVLPATTPRLTVAPASVSRPAGALSVEFCDLCNGSDWSTVAPSTAHGVRWNFGDIPTDTVLPALSFRANTSIESPNGTQYLNTARVTSPTALNPATGQAAVIVDAPSTVLATKTAVETTIPEDGTARFVLSVRNNTATTLQHLDVVDVLPAPGDGRSPESDFGGGFTAIDLPTIPAGMTAYVTSAPGAALDAADGTVDGYADPLTPGTAGYVDPGTGIWACELADVGTTGCPAVGEVTAVRVAGDGATLFPSNSTFDIPLNLDTDGNAGGDLYSNHFSARVEQSQLALPALSSDATVNVVAPDVDIVKESCTAAAVADCDPADDSVWSDEATIPDGGIGVFRISATSTGTSAGEVTVADTLPTGMDYVAGSADASQGDASTFPTEWNTGALAPGDTATLTFRATVPDGTDPGLANTVNASIEDAFGQTATDADTATLGSAPGSLTLSKTIASTTDANANGRVDVGDSINYSFTVTNTGPFDFAEVTIDDPLVPGAVCDPLSLAAGDTVTCTGSYVIDSDDADAGSVVNTATATGTPANGDAVTSDDSTATQAVNAPSAITVVKSDALTDLNGNNAADVGEEIQYSFLVTNTGQVTLEDVAVDDPKVGTVDCPSTTLAPGADQTCTATYTVTQADVDAGAVRNSATATATPANGDAALRSAASTTDTPTPAAAAALSLAKDASPFAVSAVGQTVNYQFTLTNSGNVTLTAPAVVEGAFSGSGDLGAITCPAGPIEPGDDVTCTASYTVTQDDLDAGFIDNSATATATDPSGASVTSAADNARVTSLQNPLVEVVKTVSPAAVTTVGDQVTYSFLVTNAGNVTLTGASITETSFTGSGPTPTVTCPAGDIAPTLSVTCTATYTVTQEDVDAGAIDNEATASATEPGGAQVVSAVDDATVTIDAAPEISVVKSASPSTAASFVVGATVTYSFVITNEGNVTVTDPQVTEVDFSGAGAMSDVTCAATPDGLAPGDQVVCTATYTYEQADIDAGTVTNTASASALPPTGARVVSNESDVTLPADVAPALTVEKSSDIDTYQSVGQEVTYSFLITNTGNTTITGASIDETAFSGSGDLSDIACPAGAATMAPGAQVTCTATYEITQADLDAGKVDNTAVANASAPGGTIASAPSSKSITSTAAGSIALSKRAVVADVDDSGTNDPGDTVQWIITVENTGDVTLRGVAVSDPTAGAVTCPGAELAPGQAMDCTAVQYTLTEADAVVGQLSNTATVTSQTATGATVTTDPATAVVDVVAAPVVPVPPAPKPGTVPGDLARTGADPMPVLSVATGLLLLGGMLLMIRRRRTAERG